MDFYDATTLMRLVQAVENDPYVSSGAGEALADKVREFIEEVGDVLADVVGDLAVYHVENRDTSVCRHALCRLIKPVEDHLPAERKPLHHRRIFPQQLLRVVHLRVVTRHILILSLLNLRDELIIQPCPHPPSARQCSLARGRQSARGT